MRQLSLQQCRPSLLAGTLLALLAGWLAASLAGVMPEGLALFEPARSLRAADAAGLFALAALLTVAGVGTIVAALRRDAGVLLPAASNASPGTTSVSTEGLAALVGHAIDGVDRVHAERATVSLEDPSTAWRVRARVHVDGGAALDEIDRALRSAIDQALLFHTRMPLGSLRLQKVVRAELSKKGGLDGTA